MKKFLINYILLVMGTVMAFAQSVPSNVPTAGLVAYYGFDGDASDLSGNGNNGTLQTDGISVPQLTTDRFGNGNSAYLFGGVDNANYIEVVNSSSLQMSDGFTVSFWIKQTSGKGTSSGQCYYFTDLGTATDNTIFAVLTKGGNNDESCGSAPGMAFLNKLTGRTQTLQLYNRTATNDVIRSADYNCYSLGEWIHCVMVCGAGFTRIYINGSLAFQNVSANDNHTFEAANERDLIIGGMMATLTVGDRQIDTLLYPFSGCIDDIAIYNRPVSVEEVLSLFGGYQDPLSSEAAIEVADARIVNPCGTTNGIIAITPKSVAGVTYRYGTSINNLQDSKEVSSGPGEVHYYIASTCRQWDTVVTLVCDCSEDPSLINYEEVCPGTSGERGDPAEVLAQFTCEDGSEWTTQGYWNHGRGETNYRFMDMPNSVFSAHEGDFAYFCSNLQSNNTSFEFPSTISNLTSPAIEIPYNPATTPVKLTFWYYSCGFASSTAGNFFNTVSLSYATSADGPWTEIWEISGSGHGSWNEVTLSLSSYLNGAGTYYFRFVVEGEGYSVGMDDFLITADTRWMIPEEVTVALDGDTVRTEKELSFEGACPMTEITYWYIIPRTQSDTTVYNPNGVTWEGNFYAEGGNYTKTGMTNARGCDSIAVLHLYTDVNNSADIYITACDHYTWEANGRTYTSSTLDSFTCSRCNLLTGDSTTRLHLTINRSYSRDTVVHSCSPLTWQGRTFLTDTSLTLHYTNVYQCDSTLSLRYMRHYSDTTYIVDSICQGESYPLVGYQIRVSGEYAASTDNLGGCDSTIFLKLTVKERPAINVGYEYDCHNERFILWGTTDRGYSKWVSSPTDPSLVGHEGDDTIYLGAQQNYLYTFYADIDEPMSCPTSEQVELPTPTEIKARLNVMPTYLTLDNLTLTATDGSVLDEHRTWYIDGVEQMPTSRKISYTALPTTDSVVISLTIGDGSCADSASVVIPLIHSSLYVPNVFIPTKPGEGDAFHVANNTFRAQGSGITDFEIYIYTRGGVQVFHSTDLNEGWDGFHEGKLCPQSAYTYIIRYKDDITPGNWQYKKGTVTLLH
ncbi:MAG: gliding motility-associated C-terminal domain-containing protein [Bacteroidales bacterium]|nr:gliding motility-associated C-terminal domain-containing protein [Bacteroidales bacterium]